MTDEEREKEEKKAEMFEQMQLALPGETLLVDYSKLPFQYTGDRFKARRPNDHKLAIKLIAAGQFSDYWIGKFLNVEQRVISAMRLNEITDIEQQRALIKQKSFVLGMVLGDKALELAPHATKLGEVMVGMGIAKDTWGAMSGVPTATVRVDHHFDFTAKFEELRKEAEETLKAVKKAQVIDPPALTEGE